jgi:hypothetical protein
MSSFVALACSSKCLHRASRGVGHTPAACERGRSPRNPFGSVTGELAHGAIERYREVPRRGEKMSLKNEQGAIKIWKKDT